MITDMSDLCWETIYPVTQWNKVEVPIFVHFLKFIRECDEHNRRKN